MGQGAALYPGRWNTVGIKMVYTSGSPELAMLEILTKLNPSAFGVRMAVEVDVPGDALIQDAAPVMFRAPFERLKMTTHRPMEIAGVQGDEAWFLRYLQPRCLYFEQLSH